MGNCVGTPQEAKAVLEKQVAFSGSTGRIPQCLCSKPAGPFQPTILVDPGASEHESCLCMLGVVRLLGSRCRLPHVVHMQPPPHVVHMLLPSRGKRVAASPCLASACPHSGGSGALWVQMGQSGCPSAHHARLQHTHLGALRVSAVFVWIVSVCVGALCVSTACAGAPRVPFGAPRMPFDPPRVPFGAPCVPFGALRMPFGALRVPFSQSRMPFSPPRVPFGAPRVLFGAPCVPFSPPRIGAPCVSAPCTGIHCVLPVVCISVMVWYVCISAHLGTQPAGWLRAQTRG